MENKATTYVEKKITRSYWKTLPRVVGKHPFYTPQTQFLACIDPNSYNLVKIFESIVEMEYETNQKNLQPKLHRYFKNQHGKNGSPTVCNWIVVPFKKNEMEDVTLEDFQNMIRNRAAEKIIYCQMTRIKDNMESFDNEEKQKIIQFLANAESSNPKDIYNEIQF
jgi:hypothetical protein